MAEKSKKSGKNNLNIEFIKSYSDDDTGQGKLLEAFEFIFSELKISNSEPK